MLITTVVASAVIREVLVAEAGKQYSKNKAKLVANSKIMFANDHLQQNENEFVGWWVAGATPKTAEEVVFNELVNRLGLPIAHIYYRTINHSHRPLKRIRHTYIGIRDNLAT